MASASELRSPSWCACRRSALSPASKPPRSPALLPMTTTVATRSECDASMGVASACEKASTPRPSPHRSAGTLSSAPCTRVCWHPERRISSPLSPARESSLSSSIPSSPAAPRGQRKQPRFNGCYGIVEAGSESLDVNVIIVPCGVTALEANLTVRHAQALRQVGLDEDARDLRLALEPIQHPGRPFFVDAPLRRLRLEPVEIPAQRRPTPRARQRLALSGLLVDEISDRRRRPVRNRGIPVDAAIEIRK